MKRLGAIALLVVAAAATTSRADAAAPAAARPDVDASAATTPHAATARTQSAVRRLRATLGPQALVELDPRTGTPRQIARLDGALTGPRAGAADAIARGWLTANADLLGLDAAGLNQLALSKSYRSPAGVTHVTFVQTVDGLEAFNSFVRVNVADDGRVINVVGSPVPNLKPATTQARLSAVDARAAAMRDAGATRPVPAAKSASARAAEFTDGQEAKLVLFTTASGTRPAWYLATVPASSVADYVYVVDALDGRILWRDNIVDHATGLAWEYYPVSFGAPNSGHLQTRKDFTGLGWLNGAATTLSGPNVHVYSDVDDNNLTGAGEEIPKNGANWEWPASLKSNSLFCEALRPCSWDSGTPFSWRDNSGTGTGNRAQNGTQVFYFVNTFHDWLKGSPFGFTAASGNFEGDDPVEAQNDDGAATAGGLPDDDHRNNANMGTPPDGRSPRMQMYLFADRGFFGAVDMNGGDDASILYHEYTHGLSARLVTYPSGASGLTASQSRAMGEGWSDWYAMDYLFSKGHDSGAVQVGIFADGTSDADPNAGTIRSQALNCRPGAAKSTDGSVDCAGIPPAGNGGYTYGDYGKVVGQPEVHGDGEIWAQTLWQLRDELIAAHPDGLNRARLLVTEAMRLAPPAPSFLDVRNALLAADVAAGTNDRALIWKVFAARGMGWFASATEGGDDHPIENFSAPPAGGGAQVSGRVTDLDTGAPVSDVRIGFTGHLSNLAGDLAATTDSDGRYTITGVPAGTYAHLMLLRAGYDSQLTGTLSVAGAGTTADFKVRRDWASVPGGASVLSATGEDFGEGCNATAAFDQSQSSGWGSRSDGPQTAVLQLPAPIDVRSLEIDPGAVCGDDDNASTGQARVEFSTDGVNFTTALERTFTAQQNHQMNSYAPAGAVAGTRYVRLTLLSPQTREGSGAEFLDLAELAIYGNPAAQISGGGGGGGNGGGGTGAGGAAGGVNGGGGGGVTPTPKPGPLTIPKQKLRDVLSKGLRMSITPAKRARAGISVTLDKRTASKLHLRGAAGTLKRTLPAKTTTVVVKLTKKARKALKGQRSVKFTVTVTLATKPKTTLRQAIVVSR